MTPTTGINPMTSEDYNAATTSENGVIFSDDKVPFIYVANNDRFDKDVNNYNFKLIEEKFGALESDEEDFYTNKIIQKLAKACYPINSIYTTIDSRFNPNDNPFLRQAGTWKRLIKENSPGLYIRAGVPREAEKETGGSNEITIGANNLPAHTHALKEDIHTHDFNFKHAHPAQSTSHIKNFLVMYPSGNNIFVGAVGRNMPSSGGDNYFVVADKNTVIEEHSTTNYHSDTIGTRTLGKDTRTTEKPKGSNTVTGSNTTTEPKSITVQPAYRNLYFWINSGPETSQS